MKRPHAILTLAALTLSLAACSSEPAEPEVSIVDVCNDVATKANAMLVLAKNGRGTGSTEQWRTNLGEHRKGLDAATYGIEGDAGERLLTFVGTIPTANEDVYKIDSGGLVPEPEFEAFQAAAERAETACVAEGGNAWTFVR